MKETFDMRLSKLWIFLCTVNYVLNYVILCIVKQSSMLRQIVEFL